MTDPPPKLDYRAIDCAERESVREAELRARSMGVWTTIGLALGVPALAGFLFAAWLNRHYWGAMSCHLILAIGIATAGVAIVYESRKDIRTRAFLGGLALGVAILVVTGGVLVVVALVTLRVVR